MNNDNNSNTITLSEKEYKELLEYKDGYLYMKHQLEQLKRYIYGSKRERYISEQPGQLSLFPEELSQPKEEPKKETVTYERETPKKKQLGHSRLPLSADLPRKQQIIEPKDKPKNARKIGENITEILVYEPGRFYVLQIIRPKYATDNAEDGVISAELPTLPLSRSNASASVLANIAVSKYVHHLPFYRQIQMFKEQGITIADSTLNGWFKGTCDLIRPLYDKLKQIVTKADYLMADETPIPVQDSHKKGSTHTGYHWVYYCPTEKLVCFDYRPGRDRAGPTELLKDFSGTLQTDGYTVYDYFAKKSHITMLACMAHARRYFEKAQESAEELSHWFLERIQELYAIERYARENQITTEERYLLRQEKSVPILQSIEKQLKAKLPAVLPRSPIGQAIAYTLRLWDRLQNYTQDGRYEIDNNLIENSIRPVALGRKNYLFAGSHVAAQNAAMMYSFFATCKRNDINPYEWLVDVLERIPEHKANRLEELLPGNYTKKE